MPRPRTIDDTQILAAARSVFLEAGREAPTSRIAARAGVSEGTVFKRYHTKDNLFFAAMRPTFPPTVLQLAAGEVDGERPREQLAELCVALMEAYRHVIPAMMQCWTHPSFDLEAMIRSYPKPPSVAVVEAVMGLLQRMQDAQLIGTARPEVAARALVAACHQFALFEWLGLPVVNSRYEGDPSVYARAHVDLLFDGMKPQGVDHGAV